MCHPVYDSSLLLAIAAFPYWLTKRSGGVLSALVQGVLEVVHGTKYLRTVMMFAAALSLGSSSAGLRWDQAMPLGVVPVLPEHV